MKKWDLKKNLKKSWAIDKMELQLYQFRCLKCEWWWMLGAWYILLSNQCEKWACIDHNVKDYIVHKKNVKYFLINKEGGIYLFAMAGICSLRMGSLHILCSVYVLYHSCSSKGKGPEGLLSEGRNSILLLIPLMRRWKYVR